MPKPVFEPATPRLLQQCLDCLTTYLLPTFSSVTTFTTSAHHHHYHQSLNARVVGAPQMILLPVFSIFPCPLGLAELQACPFPDVVFLPLPLSALSSSPFHCALQNHLFLCLPCLLPPFTVSCKMVLARPDERET